MGCRFYIIDAFTDRPFRGNPAVVVPDASGLSDYAMQRLAAELRMEAGFVLPPSATGAQIRLRFFSPGAEQNVSGHVTVAAYAALAADGHSLPAGLAPGARRLVRQESRAGVLPVELYGGADGTPEVVLSFGKPAFGAAVDRQEVEAALRLKPGALQQQPAPRMVTAGVAMAVASLDGLSILHRVVPDMPRVTTLSRKLGLVGLVAYARPGVDPHSALAARFFFPAVGPDEDIVSGASLAAIIAYAVRERQLTCIGEQTYQTDQGHALGRPNRAQVTVHTENGVIADVRVRGRGAVVARGEFTPALE
jgi:PhzF family phenazine biosynthesis protein